MTCLFQNKQALRDSFNNVVQKLGDRYTSSHNTYEKMTWQILQDANATNSTPMYIKCYLDLTYTSYDHSNHCDDTS